MPRHGVGLNDLLGGPEPRGAELRTSRPKTEARTIERASRTGSRSCPKQWIRRGKSANDDRRFQSRATQRMRNMSAPSDATEVATYRKLVRRAQATEADESQLRPAQLQDAFHRLTPELSRPVAGRRTRASVAYSTWPTPRHGVGLNDLLGGPEARDTGLWPRRPKTEARPLERASQTFSRLCPKQRIRRGKRADDSRRFRSRPTQRMRHVSAHRAATEETTCPRTVRRACRPKLENWPERATDCRMLFAA